MGAWPWPLKCGIQVTGGLGGQSTVPAITAAATKSHPLGETPSPANAPCSATRPPRGLRANRPRAPALLAAHTTRVCFVMGTTVPPVQRPAPL